jgi:hypothetical protein
MLPDFPPETDELDSEVGFIRANHRFTDEFCSKYPHRLKSLIVVSSRAIEASVEEIRRWACAPWAIGIHPNLRLAAVLGARMDDQSVYMSYVLPKLCPQAQRIHDGRTLLRRRWKRE